MNKYKTFEELKEELGDKFEEYMYKANIELLTKIDKENQKYKEVIDKAIDKCNKTLDYINNTLLENNVKVELTELLKIKGGLDIILESLVEDQLKRWNK